MISQIEWSEAEETLNSLCSGCDSFSPEDISEAARRRGLHVQFIPLPGWESCSDQELFDTILNGIEIENDRLVVITEASLFGKAGPFEMSGHDFRMFLPWHLASFDECVVNGDVILMLRRQKIISIFRHEGWYANIVP